jgi:acyl carrier protein
MRERLAAAPADERADLLFAHVQEQVVKVLGLDAARPPASDDGLTDMGMDSLMAVELRNRFQASLGLTLPATLAFEHPTIAALNAVLAVELQLAPAPTVSAESSRAGTPAAKALGGLSAEELEASLLDELKDAGY